MNKEKEIIQKLQQEANRTDIFDQVKEYAADYIKKVNQRNVFPSKEAIENLRYFDGTLPEEGDESYEILKKLQEYGSPATVAQTGGRYFGFVNGGIIPASLGAKWLGDVWDQNAALYCISPIASKLEEVCEKWIIDLLGLPEESTVGFVSGSSTATLCGLLAARNYLLGKQNYDVSRQGLIGAPRIRIVMSEEAHSSVVKAISILGLGSNNIEIVPSDDDGRIDSDKLPELDEQTILILQAGNVNSGAFDYFHKLCKRAKKAGAWVHVDGAFGLWAAASPRFIEMTRDMELADSWSCDGHKTLNAPYDNGIIICKDRKSLTDALQMEGSYLLYSEKRDGMLTTLDMSRRARSIELWAIFMSLGRKGVAQLVENLHEKANYFADSLKQKGFEILNDICFNQIVVNVGDDKTTQEFLTELQTAGVCWCGSSKWKGMPVIRISVCSYRTTFEYIDNCVESFVSVREKR